MKFTKYLFASIVFFMGVLLVGCSNSSGPFTLIVQDFDDTILYTNEFYYQDEIPDLNLQNPVHEGYVFAGWNPSIPETMPESDLVVRAEYIVKDRTIESAIDGFRGYTNDIYVSSDYVVALETAFGLYSGPFTIYKLSDPTYKRSLIDERYDNYGTGVLISGDYIVVSSTMYNDEQGCLYVYKFLDETYERQITGLDSSAGDMFGETFLISGDYVIVGSPKHADGEGKVYVYKLSDETYEREITITTRDQDYQNFGLILHATEEYLLIGTNYRTNAKGVIYMYKFDDDQYVRRMEMTTSTDFNQNFSQIETYGDYIIVSAERANQGRGVVYLFKFSDIDFEREIVGTGADEGDFFGTTFVYQNDYVIIGAPGYNDEQGAIFVYKFSDASYERQINWPKEDERGPESFGNAIAVEGNYFAVGAHSYNSRTGEVVVFKFDDESYERHITGTNTYYSSFFGLEIKAVNDYLIITAFLNNNDQGAIYIYKFSNESFEYQFKPDDGSETTYFGGHIEISDNYIITSSYISKVVDSLELHIFKIIDNIDE